MADSATRLPKDTQSSTRLRSNVLLSLRSLLLLLAMPLSCLVAWASPNQSGRWTGGSDPNNHWSAIEVHMAILRGDTLYHSKILAWQEHAHPDIAFRGVLKGWNPPPDSAAQCLLYKGQEFNSLSLQGPGTNIFCSGFIHLSNGKLLVVGGHEAEETGTKTSITFDPNAATQWVQQGSMSARRWYPTATPLPDGRVLATGGSEYDRAYFYGGSTGPQATSADADYYVHRLALTEQGIWDPRVKPDDFTPPPVVDHTMVRDEGLTTSVLFGGRDTTGTLTNDVWLLFADDKVDSGETYHWAKKTISGAKPSARRLHASAARSDSDQVVIFGGLGSGGTVYSDVWETFPTAFLGDTTTNWMWVNLSPTGTSPGARYAHAALFELQSHRMLIYGGRTTGGTATDNNVWELRFKNGDWLNRTGFSGELFT